MLLFFILHYLFPDLMPPEGKSKDSLLQIVCRDGRVISICADSADDALWVRFVINIHNVCFKIWFFDANSIYFPKGLGPWLSRMLDSTLWVSQMQFESENTFTFKLSSSAASGTDFRSVTEAFADMSWCVL